MAELFLPTNQLASITWASLGLLVMLCYGPACAMPIPSHTVRQATMSIRVILTVHLKPENVGEIKSGLRDLLPDTRAFEGCEEISVIQSQDDPNTIVILEQWATRPDYEAYFKWRTDTGAIAMMNDMSTEPVQPKYFDIVRV